MWAMHPSSSGGMDRLAYTTAELLIHAGADVNTKDNHGNTPLIRSVKWSEVTQLLLQNGAVVNEIGAAGRTALGTAASSGYTKSMVLLMAAKADLNIQDQDGNTPLMLAVLGKQRIAVQILLKAGADPNLKNKKEETAMKIAQNASLTEIEGMLQTAGAR
jgi:ankyrin repeat protein